MCSSDLLRVLSRPLLKQINIGIVFEIFLIVLITILPPLQGVFHTCPLNLEDYALLAVMYAELNTKSDYCQCCGYDGEIKIVEDDGKLVWECPNCGNRDQSKMNVARRTCGYIGTQFWNQGRTEEIKDRVLHL